MTTTRNNRTQKGLNSVLSASGADRLGEEPIARGASRFPADPYDCGRPPRETFDASMLMVAADVIHNRAWSLWIARWPAGAREEASRAARDSSRGSHAAHADNALASHL